MTSQATETTTPPPPPANTALRVCRLAARAWIEMDTAGVLPTPKNFDLWYAHLSGANPELSRRLLALTANDATPSAAALDALHAECVAPGPEIDVDAIEDGSEAIQQAAQAVVEQIAGNGGRCGSMAPPCPT